MPGTLRISLVLPNSLGCQKFDSQLEDARTRTLACLWSFSGLTGVPWDEWCHGNQQPHGWQRLTTYPQLSTDSLCIPRCRSKKETGRQRPWKRPWKGPEHLCWTEWDGDTGHCFGLLEHSQGKKKQKQKKNAEKKPRSPRNTTHYHSLCLHEEWGTIGIKYLCNWAAYFAFFSCSTTMMCSAFRKTQKRVVQFSSVA